MEIKLPKIHQGKVRDVYQIDDSLLLMVASDRLSAFDVVLPDPIPLKGAILTQISNFWFEQMRPIIKNHLADVKVSEVIADATWELQARSVVVKKLKALPCEAIVRGYIIGSGWKDYLATGKVCGIKLPTRLQQAEKLDNILFTPSSKAAVGQHDENITIGQLENLIGKEMASQLQNISVNIYQRASNLVESRGLIIADTKFEFGLDNNDELVLMDEVLTPDSSRFWDRASYQIGTSPESYDKQYVRDYLETLEWDKTPPGPKLPEQIINKTAEKYHEAYQRITGQRFKRNEAIVY